MAELQKATFAGGCFWCTEAIFKRVKGVESVQSGYSGGDTENPDYHQVGNGNTGHAEAIQIEFDPEIISYSELLEIFFKTHDPTTLNRQGADIGTQYRSAIFYHSDEQKKDAEKIMEKLSPDFNNPIVTEISEYKNFYNAEDYHDDYYERNKNTAYCRAVIDPKLQKFFEKFGDKAKKEFKSQ